MQHNTVHNAQTAMLSVRTQHKQRRSPAPPSPPPPPPSQVRVRLAAVPGAPDSAAVQQMVALFAQSLGRASMDTLQVGRGDGIAVCNAPLTPFPPSPPCPAQVVVLSARNLPPRPAAIALGMRDAYCNISFAGARQVTGGGGRVGGGQVSEGGVGGGRWPGSTWLGAGSDAPPGPCLPPLANPVVG